MKASYLFAVLSMFVACKDNNQPTPTPTPPPAVSLVPSAIASVPPPPPTLEKVELQLETVGNTMAFDKTTLEVPAKSQVHLTLKNNSTLETMPHNWVLVNKGKVVKVGTEAMQAGAQNDYVDANDEDVLAHTPLALPGKTVEITFMAPKYPGTYEFCCSVMGHWAGGMRGTFLVK